MALIKDLKASQGITVKYIYCENAGEINAFEKLCKNEVIVVMFEVTMPGMPGMPQQYGRGESKISIL